MIDTETQLLSSDVPLTTDVQLINVGGQGDIHDMADFPYGLALMVGYLRAQGFDTQLNQYPTWKKEEYLGAILDNPAYLYGFQVSFDNYPEIRELVTLIKERNPLGNTLAQGVSCYFDPHLPQNLRTRFRTHLRVY